MPAPHLVHDFGVFVMLQQQLSDAIAERLPDRAIAHAPQELVQLEIVNERVRIHAID
jgi:hypothetical protein